MPELQNAKSLLGKKWQIGSAPIAADLLSRLLQVRKISATTEFLQPDYAQQGHAPELLKDFTKARERVERAINQGERILIVGDYDADGIAAAALLFKVLRSRTANVSVRLPHRVKHGYGLNQAFIQEARELKVDLLITVDNGSAAYAEVCLAQEFGIDVIITDHHLPPSQLPPAYAILNPRRVDCAYPNKDLAGAAVAFKLASSLNQDADLAAEILALATIGTVADVCEISQENRALVASGLKVLARLPNPGLRQICQNAALKANLTTEDIGFRLAPRLNAAGRLADPLLAFQALTHQEGATFAQELEKLNLKRQKITQVAERLALASLDRESLPPVLVIFNPELPIGIIGLVAGKLAEKFFRPVLVFTEIEAGIVTGSARCPQANFNITQALAQNADLLLKFGGHRTAAGCTLKKANLKLLEQRLTDFLVQELTEADLVPMLNLDLEVTLGELSLANFREVQKLAPFGPGNLEPVFYLRQVELKDLRLIGREQRHLKFWLKGTNLEVVGFNFGEQFAELQARSKFDLAFRLKENSWQQQTKLELQLVDLR